MTIFIRVDSSIKIGSGHVMRCLTLADELRNREASVYFICREHQGNLISFIREKGFDVHTLPCFPNEPVSGDLYHSSWLGTTWQKDAQEVKHLLKSFEAKEGAVQWLIVDHYALDGRWENQLRALAEKIMVIDDLADRPHNCDLLLDQNFYLEEGRYQELIPQDCIQLIGPQYALLRPEFAQLRKELPQRDGEIRRIFIFFGSADPTNETGKALEAIEQIEGREFEVDVVLGASNPNRETVKEQVSSMKNAKMHIQVKDMAKLMASADLAIGAGGVNAWERCCLGLPSLVITVAENQEIIAGNLAIEGAILLLGKKEVLTREAILKHLECLFINRHLLLHMSQKTFSLVDGKGTKRVVDKMISPNLKLRLANLDDKEQVFQWRNHVDTRKYFFDPSPISWENHSKWFEETLKNPRKYLLMGTLNDREIGVLRYDFVGKSTLNVSIYMVPGQSGKGLGSFLLSCGNQWVKENVLEANRIQAEVIPSNLASLKVFLKAGFKETHNTFEFQIPRE